MTCPERDEPIADRIPYNNASAYPDVDEPDPDEDPEILALLDKLNATFDAAENGEDNPEV